MRLDTFYQSKQWVNLMAVLKQERVNEQGDIICEHCGLPIVRKYDCIGHHTIELTENNVDDAEISLNPDNIALVHHKCHNIIHNKLSYGHKEIYLVYGSPLSGKSTWVESVRNDGDLIVDIDNIWQCVSGCARYEKPGKLNAVVFAVRDKLLECVRLRRGKWTNAYIIGGYPLISERERLCRELGAREIYIECSREECIRRLMECKDGRDIEAWTGYIDDWFRKYAPRIYS